MIRKDAQRYRCQDCESIFNDLTRTVFAEHQFTIPEMFHITRGMEEHTTNEIRQKPYRTYKTVLDFVHEVQDKLAGDPEFALSGVCEADGVYVATDERGLEDEDTATDERLEI